MARMVSARHRVPSVLSKRACFAGVVTILTIAGQAGATEAPYTCSGGAKLTARFSPPGTEMGTVALIFATGETITLPQVISADGGRYAGNGVEFWIKGRSATLTRNGVSETCSTK
ncbi:MliC family protein [Rhodoblastus sp.]|uniref:MliC family protein n=1 Tax=Rhodoblastus sp. TaxID=1962975 RepID=UPI0025D4F411|nr:MliC family protein [Rhodoblastus sp.]